MDDISKNELPEALVRALSRCDLLVGRETVDYFYELYDSRTGGFYYSISSRDLEGMTPFAEGTRFVMESLRNGGITFPDWYKEKVGKWILSHQDPDDGYFYEELWGKTTSGPRLDRDLTYSRDILINYCGMQPLYPLPQERLMKKENNATIPEYLKSAENMISYMDSLGWSNARIWGTGQRLSSAVSLVRAAGLFDTVYDHIVSRQNPETGLWGEKLDWMSTNGGMKLSSYFNAEHPCPNPERVIESVLALFASGTAAPCATYIWNPFVLLKNLIQSYTGERREQLRTMLLEKGADIVNFAVDSALLLKRPDGGFSSNIDRAQKTQQGYPYGLGLENESDMDGTVIAGQRLRATIHGVFGVSCSHDYYADLGDSFWERCKNKPQIVKTKNRILDKRLSH